MSDRSDRLGTVGDCRGEGRRLLCKSTGQEGDLDFVLVGDVLRWIG